jgi:hypothetical protein
MCVGNKEGEEEAGVFIGGRSQPNLTLTNEGRIFLPYKTEIYKIVSSLYAFALIK